MKSLKDFLLEIKSKLAAEILQRPSKTWIVYVKVRLLNIFKSSSSENTLFNFLYTCKTFDAHLFFFKG